jgi:SNW domain-containing protein 1
MSDWKISPNVSDWKNSGGYCIPLDKRMVADDRWMKDVQVSDGFASLSEALYVTEQKARVAIQTYDKVVKELEMKADVQRGQQLCEMANRVRAEMASGAAAAWPMDAELSEQRIQRHMVHEERRRQRECERQREAPGGKKSRIMRDRDQDVSERIALGMASTGGGAGAGELTYDKRLFNQDTGIDSGFVDDQYNVYSGRLFAVQPLALSMLYRTNKHGDSDVYGGADEHIEKIARIGRFRPDKVFSSAPNGRLATRGTGRLSSMCKYFHP